MGGIIFWNILTQKLFTSISFNNWRLVGKGLLQTKASCMQRLAAERLAAGKCLLQIMSCCRQILPSLWYIFCKVKGFVKRRGLISESFILLPNRERLCLRKGINREITVHWNLAWNLLKTFLKFSFFC